MTVFVTGGSRGIGRTIVLKMAAEGYDCAFTYVKMEDAATETLNAAEKINPKVRVKAYRLNQAVSAEVETVVDRALEDFGEIQILVNNAAVNRNNATVLMSDDEWNDVITTNLSGPFYLIRQFLMPMLARKFGRIINISSLAQYGASGQAGYAASKAGLVGLTKSIAKEYGSKGITANVITVGYVPTDLTSDQMSENLKRIWMEYSPIKRVGRPEDIADAVHYLITGDTGFINGENLHVTGGMGYMP